MDEQVGVNGGGWERLRARGELFVYLLMWPAGLLYAYALGGSFAVCLREGRNPFGWAMSELVLVAALGFPLTALVLIFATLIAAFARPAPERRWKRRLLWLGGAMLAVLVLGLLGNGETCHIAYM